MAIEIRPVTLPIAQGSLQNGKLNACQLKPVYFPKHGYLSLGVITAPNWEALTTVCKAQTGVTLTASSAADAYRTYERQVTTFTRSYVAIFNAETCYDLVDSRNRTWNEVRYYLLKENSAKAVPGTSNHGYGLAIDVAIYNALTNVVSGISGRGWEWLQNHATHYGFSWESLPDSKGWEPWHIRYVLGDMKSPGLIELEHFFQKG